MTPWSFKYVSRSSVDRWFDAIVETSRTTKPRVWTARDSTSARLTP